jgi:dolichol kinase
MMNAPFLLLALAFLLLFAVSELLYRYAGIRAEQTRRIVHAGSGILTLLFPLFFDSLLSVAMLCGAFLFLLALSMRYTFLPSINAVTRKTAGSLLYPVIVVVCFAFYQWKSGDPDALFKPLYYFYLPLMLLAFCDPVAALAGSAWRKRHPRTAHGKTFAGSFSFFGLAILICIALSLIFTRHLIPSTTFIAIGMTTAFATAIAERFGDRGWDNMTIPVAAMACIYFAETIF